MGRQDVSHGVDSERLRAFTKCILRDLLALERIIADGLFETDVRRVGTEQEMFLVDRYWRPALKAVEVLEALDDPRFTTELGQFNLEVNLPPVEFRGDCLRRTESSILAALARVREAAATCGTRVVLTGILPTLRQTDLSLDSMTPMPRYHVLNDMLIAMRGGPFELHVRGIDEINVRQDSVMLEACNTSAQFHLQVTPEEFPRLYNVAQAVTAPVLAAGCNSPMLFGKRLWRETRIAVFEQSIDTRLPMHHMQELAGRVSFGTRWVRDSVVEVFQEDLTRFRVFLGLDVEEDPFDVLARGEVPELHALALHNGTVYRWNRPCYGVGDGRAHLRIENRALPSGPTVVDEVANGAFWYGLVLGMGCECDCDVTRDLDFDTAKANFVTAARRGLDARFTWLDGRRWTASDLIRTELLPLAERGLRGAGIDADDIERYLGIIDRRVETGKTGAEWMARSYSEMYDKGTAYGRVRALVAAMAKHEPENEPVHEWPPARLDDAADWRLNYERVGQYMTTDVFSVHEDEVIDLVASMMAWRKIRHVPVEDDDRRIVGMITATRLLRHIARELPKGGPGAIPAREVMDAPPVTVSPDTPTHEAIEMLRHRGMDCLLVTSDDRLVGIVTDHDFLEIAGNLLKEIPAVTGE
ncbi:MAG: CBS domain-containing protein [Planctomycetota bacterium]|jgi:CBS domain-containing protein/gamma-glutamylcysteine synthetase